MFLDKSAGHRGVDGWSALIRLGVALRLALPVVSGQAVSFLSRGRFLHLFQVGCAGAAMLAGEGGEARDGSCASQHLFRRPGPMELTWWASLRHLMRLGS